MLARAYLRASTADQDASRARDEIEAFAAERGLPVAGVAITYEDQLGEPSSLVQAVRAAAAALTRRLGGSVTPTDSRR